jgi:hypothetical protein
MAHSSAVLTAYTSLRAAFAEHNTFDPKVGAALTLATAAGVGNGYMIRIASRLAHMNSWTEEQVTALRTGTPDEHDVLTGLVREAAANSGEVTDATWKAAQQAGWSEAQVADAFAYVGATVLTGYFLNSRKPIWMPCGRSSGADAAAPGIFAGFGTDSIAVYVAPST